MILLIVVVFVETVGLCFLLCFTEMNAFLFGMVWFF